MPGLRASPAQRTQFWSLIAAGLSSPRAAEKVGMSQTWGWRMMKSGSGASSVIERQREARSLPDPKSFEELSTDAKAMLADFDVFCELGLARRPAPWRRDAAMRTVEMILDKTERTFAIGNVFPGAGKSSLWTLDIPLWLLCGGGTLDPAYGRALRIMLGHQSMTVAVHYVKRLARILQLARVYYDKEQQRHASVVLASTFGRFRPDQALGEESLWREDQFLVAQLQAVDLYEKEPTVQAASRQAGFLGERVDYASWDDLVTSKNSRDAQVAASTSKWFEDEAEPRIEPGGVLWLVGQRLGPLDLFRDRLNKVWTDEEGFLHQRYVHIVYPAHHDATCDGAHRQWDLKEDGCLLDEHRMPWKELVKLRGEPNFRTIMQQEDSDPASTLVLPLWIDGGVDIYGSQLPGCYDRDRAFFEHPADVESLVNYVCVDPATTGWWAIEWWAVQPETRIRYLIWGARRKMGAGDFLDWHEIEHTNVGVMEDLQARSEEAGQPIRVWVIESNAAQRYLFQHRAFDLWRSRWPAVTVMQFQTQRNKSDPKLGIEGTLPMAYRSGMKRLPRKEGTEALNYIRQKVDELTTWPYSATADTVMADWFGEFRLDDIIRLGSRATKRWEPDVKLPRYLVRQRIEAHRPGRGIIVMKEDQHG